MHLAIRPIQCLSTPASMVRRKISHPSSLILIVILAVSTSLFAETGQSRQAEVDSLYHAAVAGIGVAPMDDSVDAFRSILKKSHRKHAPSFWRLARLYLNENTLASRQRALIEIKKAMRIDRLNRDYQLTHADILWAQGFHSLAQQRYLEALPPDSTAAGIEYRIGYRALQLFLEMKDLDISGDKDLAKAEHFLSASIRTNPRLTAAYQALALLYIESGQQKAAVAIARKLLSYNPDELETLLLCGLAHQSYGKEQVAADFYRAAMDRMTEEQRSVFESVEDLGAEPNASAEAVERFWRTQDPLLLTEHNERRMAHYGRIAYASLRFVEHERGLSGWETPMGRTYIRFGQPLAVLGKVGQAEFIMQGDYIPSPLDRNLTVETYKQDWLYEGYRVRFESYGGRDWNFGAYHIEPGMWKGEAARMVRSGIWPASGQEVFRETPSRYIDPFRHQKYSTPVQWAAFRRGDSVRVDISYVIPGDRVRATSLDSLRLDEGVYLLDEDWRPVYHVESEVSLWRSFGPGPVSKLHLGRRSLTVAPGDYTLVLEVGDRLGGSIATHRRPVHFGYLDDTVLLSDLVLATTISPDLDSPLGPDDELLVPNPPRTYPRSDKVQVYFEMYNLTRDSFGRTHYEIDYQVAPAEAEEVDPRLFVVVAYATADRVSEVQRKLVYADTDSPSVRAAEAPEYAVTYEAGKGVDGTGAVVELAAGDSPETTVRSEYRGDASDDFTFLRVDVSRLPKGVHTLGVTLTDMVSGDTASRRAQFRVQ
jgi:GWxTD domain-containing protein